MATRKDKSDDYSTDGVQSADWQEAPQKVSLSEQISEAQIEASTLASEIKEKSEVVAKIQQELTILHEKHGAAAHKARALVIQRDGHNPSMAGYLKAMQAQYAQRAEQAIALSKIENLPQIQQALKNASGSPVDTARARKGLAE
jgi:hypothetical protein